MITNISGTDEMGQVWTDTGGNVFVTNPDTPHGQTVTATTPSGFTGQGYTAKGALDAAKWYEEKAAKNYTVKPLDEVMTSLTDEERQHWTEKAESLYEHQLAEAIREAQ